MLRTVDDLRGRLDHLVLTDDDEGEDKGLRHVTLEINTRDVERVWAALDQLRARPEVRAVRVTNSGSDAA